MKNILIPGLCLILAGCVITPQRTALSFYDDCAQQHASFVAMAQCGRVTRNAFCTVNKSCTANGNATVQYADSLAKSVKTHELTEAAAQRKWIEFRMSQENAMRQESLQRAAIMQASQPVTCNTIGTVTNCF